jgi:phosphoribosylaminoimidazole (AIR) synthetase
LLQAFNMGIGMIVIVPSAYVKEAEADLKRRREKFYRIGRIEKGDTGKARIVYSGSLNL